MVSSVTSHILCFQSDCLPQSENGDNDGKEYTIVAKYPTCETCNLGKKNYHDSFFISTDTNSHSPIEISPVDGVLYPYIPTCKP